MSTVTATITPGRVFQEGDAITVSALNQLGTPTIDITGAASGATIDNNSISNVHINSNAVIDWSKMASLNNSYLLVGNTSNEPIAVQMTGDISMSSTGATTIGDATVGTAQVEDNAVTEGKLATAVSEKLIPTGTMMPYAASSPPTGWLLCDGSELSASETALEAVLNGNYGTGSNGRSNVPDMRGRMAVGVDGLAGRLDSNESLGSSAAHADVSSGSGNRLPSYLITEFIIKK